MKPIGVARQCCVIPGSRIKRPRAFAALGFWSASTRIVTYDSAFRAFFFFVTIDSFAFSSSSEIEAPKNAHVRMPSPPLAPQL